VKYTRLFSMFSSLISCLFFEDCSSFFWMILAALLICLRYLRREASPVKKLEDETVPPNRGKILYPLSANSRRMLVLRAQIVMIRSLVKMTPTGSVVKGVENRGGWRGD